MHGRQNVKLGEEWSTSALTRERTPVPTEQEAGWASQPDGRLRKESLAPQLGIKTRNVQPLAWSLY